MTDLIEFYYYNIPHQLIYLFNDGSGYFHILN